MKNKLKKIIITIISDILKSISELLVRCCLVTPKVFVYVDGGICSQMFMYLCGRYYAEYGFIVKYDLRWYDRTSKILTGVNKRTFELTEMWPNIVFKQAKPRQAWFYNMFLRADRGNSDLLMEPSRLHRSVYLDGYWDLPHETRKRLFNAVFKIESIAKINNSIEFGHYCGVHVRRGDLAKGDNIIYGGVTDGYFIRAIEYVRSHYPQFEFLFFSDEPDWVEKNIISKIDVIFKIIRGNKAWEDLRLLSLCEIIIASQGSFGKVAAQLNPKALLIICDNKYANKQRTNTILIS